MVTLMEAKQKLTLGRTKGEEWEPPPPVPAHPPHPTTNKVFQTRTLL